MSEFIVSSVSFTPDGLELAFMELPTDVRNEGRLVRTRSYLVSAEHPAYADEVAQLRELAEALVRDVDEDWDDAPVYDPADEADDEGGMGE
jgi:hypothetical protein